MIRCLVLCLICHSTLLKADAWSLGLALGFPDVPASRLGFDVWPRQVTLFAQAAEPFLFEVYSRLPRKTLSKMDTVAIQNEAQPIRFDVHIQSLYVAGLEWFPWQDSWFLQSAYEKRQIEIQTRVRSRFYFLTAQGQSLARSEADASLKSTTDQDVWRLALGQKFALGTSWQWGWYAGWSRVLGAKSQVQAQVGLRNGTASRASEGRADNLGEALAAQAANLEASASRELKAIGAQSLPLIGLSLGYHL